MAWVRGIVTGRINDDGRIIAETRALEVMQGLKPGTPKEAQDAGMDLAAGRQIQERKPGPFSFMGYFGGATAMVVPFVALTLLDERRMRRLYEKYFGPLKEGEKPCFPEDVAIMHVRNTGAPARQNDAEPSGGMAETTDLLVEQVGEMVEMGVLRSDHQWTRFLLPSEVAMHQEAFNHKQFEAWNLFSQALWVRGESAQLELLRVGRDQFNGQSGIVTAGPVGDVAVTYVAKVHLNGTGWKFLDLETHNGNPMRRKMVAIVPRPYRSPLVLQLDENGGLDDFGHHFVLCGENVDLCVTHIGKAVLQALGWLL
ncbi:MAG: hypothetical protein Q7S16_00110 [bacterium]|nr:hypothetical protein [bacterium]